MNKKIFIGLSFLVLLIGLLDFKYIPFYTRPGLDFSNHYGFHHCKESDVTIYKKEAKDCLDFEARPYVYPPLMYPLFSWTRLFPTFDGAYYFFVGLYVLSFIGIILIWADKKILPIIYGLGLFITFPNLFLIERGNTDLFITLFWSLAYWFYKKDNQWVAGFFIAIAVFSKLYPVYSLFVLAFFILRNLKLNTRLIYSMGIFAVLILIAQPSLWFEYFVDVLPSWSGNTQDILNLAHSFKSLPKPLGSVLYFTVLAFWATASSKLNEKYVAWVFAGGFAISTFSNGVSFDYNLVTLFPLLILMFAHLMNYMNRTLSIAFVLLTFLSFSFREIFISLPVFSGFRIVLMGLCLVSIPYLMFDLGHEIIKLKFIFSWCRIFVSSKCKIKP